MMDSGSGGVAEERVFPNSEANLERAMGCILGAFCGDAIGAPVEFSNSIIPERKLKEVMNMSISGVHNLVPGQITDDSEMAISLLHGLIEVSLFIK